MENKENLLNPELNEEELDKVSGGIIPDFKPVDLIYEPQPELPQPDPFLDDPNSFTKPSQPDVDPKFI